MLNNLETDNISPTIHRAMPVQIHINNKENNFNNNAKMVYSTSPTDTNTDSSESSKFY